MGTTLGVRLAAVSLLALFAATALAAGETVTKRLNPGDHLAHYFSILEYELDGFNIDVKASCKDTKGEDLLDCNFFIVDDTNFDRLLNNAESLQVIDAQLPGFYKYERSLMYYERYFKKGGVYRIVVMNIADEDIAVATITTKEEYTPPNRGGAGGVFASIGIIIGIIAGVLCLLVAIGGSILLCCVGVGLTAYNIGKGKEETVSQVSQPSDVAYVAME